MSEYTILFCDDELEICATHAGCLRDEGYRVIECNSGEEAIEIAKIEKIDIILMDYFMNGITGEEAISEIRKFNRDSVIILQTAFSGEKPAMEMFKSLEIQGYHDKQQGIDGLLFWVATAVKIREQALEIKKAYDTIKSIKEEQEKLIKRERLAAIGEFTGSIMESLENPINSISISISCMNDSRLYLKENIGNPDFNIFKQHKALDFIYDKILSISNQLSYMRSIEKTIEEYTIDSNINKFTIKNLLESINNIISEFVHKHDDYLNISCKIDQNTLVKGNLVNLTQVLNNLIVNSIQAYDGKKECTVNLIIDESDNKLIFKINDYGKGIPKEIQEKLFNTTISTTKGAGIGLYNSNIIIKDKFKGEIWFESEKDKGTTFFITIPYNLNN